MLIGILIFHIDRKLFHFKKKLVVQLELDNLDNTIVQK